MFHQLFLLLLLVTSCLLEPSVAFTTVKSHAVITSTNPSQSPLQALPDPDMLSAMAQTDPVEAFQAAYVPWSATLIATLGGMGQYQRGYDESEKKMKAGIISGEVSTEEVC